MIFETAEPSRTGVPGLLRPRDDVHALLVALHGWIGGMRRSRDLLDALLLATVSPVPVEETAAGLGLARFWRWTVRFAEAELQGRTDRATDAAHRIVFAGSSSALAERWTRVVAPYLTATPWRVTRGHLYDYSIVREARRAAGPDRRSTPGD